MPVSTRSVFLSYRREETRHIAGRLADRLTERLGSTQVFMDVDTIEPGADFAAAIARAVASCDVLIALIGPTWSTILDRRGRRRIDDPDDFVVLEIQAALERDIHIIPVLVDGADMPERYDLPEGLQQLTRRNAVRLDHETFRSDIGTLLDAVERMLPNLTPKATRHTRQTSAQAATSKANQASDDNKLGLRLAKQGDFSGARAAFQRAIDSGDAEAAPTAANNLGWLFAMRQDVAGARAAYQRAIDSGHAEAAPTAAVNLGWLLDEQGDSAAARVAYQRAIDSGHAEAAPTAAVNLGWLLATQGDFAGAKAAYQRAIDSGHPDQAPLAAVKLGLLLTGMLDVAGAQAAYRRAIDSGHTNQAPIAANNLGLLLAELGDIAGAKAAYQLVIDSGHPDQAPKAAANLRRLQ